MKHTNVYKRFFSSKVDRGYRKSPQWKYVGKIDMSKCKSLIELKTIWNTYIRDNGIFRLRVWFPNRGLKGIAMIEVNNGEITILDKRKYLPKLFKEHMKNREMDYSI